MSWAWWDWRIRDFFVDALYKSTFTYLLTYPWPGWLAIILQCCDTVGWVMWLTKIVSEMTYNVSSGTLNSTKPYHRGVDLRGRGRVSGGQGQVAYKMLASRCKEAKAWPRGLRHSLHRRRLPGCSGCGCNRRNDSSGCTAPRGAPRGISCCKTFEHLPWNTSECPKINKRFIRKNKQQICCHQTLFQEAKCVKMRWWPRLCLRPRCGSLQCWIWGGGTLWHGREGIESQSR